MAYSAMWFDGRGLKYEFLDRRTQGKWAADTPGRLEKLARWDITREG